MSTIRGDVQCVDSGCLIYQLQSQIHTGRKGTLYHVLGWPRTCLPALCTNISTNKQLSFEGFGGISMAAGRKAARGDAGLSLKAGAAARDHVEWDKQCALTHRSPPGCKTGSEAAMKPPERQLPSDGIAGPTGLGYGP